MNKKQHARRQHHNHRYLVARGLSAHLMVGIALVALLFAIAVIVRPAGAESTPNPSVAPKAVELQHAQSVATARAQHPVKPANAVPPPSQPTPALVAGIFQTRQGPFSNSMFSVADGYQGSVGTRWLVVFAGTEWTTYPTDGEGALRIYSVGGGYVGTFVAPLSSSYLDITGVKGTTLTLLADDRTPLTFDLANDTFAQV